MVRYDVWYGMVWYSTMVCTGNRMNGSVFRGLWARVTLIARAVGE